MKVTFYADWFNELLLDEKEAKEWLENEKANLMAEDDIVEEFFEENEISAAAVWKMFGDEREAVEIDLNDWMEKVAQSNFEDNFEKIVKEV